MLHDVRPFNENFFPERYKQHSFLSDVEFSKGIKSIKNSIIGIDQFLNDGIYLSSSKYLNHYTLTFDDGLKDHLWVADLLASNNTCAAFFIPFGVIEENSFIHSHLIQFLNASGKRLNIAQDLYELLSSTYCVSPQEISSYKISRWKNNVWTEEEVFITRVLREFFNYESREKVLLNLCRKYLTSDLKDMHATFYLSADDVKLIREMGHLIGSHGYYSLDLRYESPVVVDLELNNSYSFLNDQDTINSLISYPNGGFSSEIKNSVLNAGYKFGFSTIHRSINADDDKLNIPRLDGTKLGIFK